MATFPLSWTHYDSEWFRATSRANGSASSLPYSGTECPTGERARLPPYYPPAFRAPPARSPEHIEPIILAIASRLAWNGWLELVGNTLSCLLQAELPTGAGVTLGSRARAPIVRPVTSIRTPVSFSGRVGKLRLPMRQTLQLDLLAESQLASAFESQRTGLDVLDGQPDRLEERELLG